MKILKVKIAKDEKISIEYLLPAVNTSTKSMLLPCADKARPEFYKTLKKLWVFACGICEYPNDTKITLPAISFSYHGDNEVMGVIFTVSKVLQGSDQPLITNTPIKYVDAINDSTGENQLLQNECEEAVLELVDECTKYINGDRNQVQAEGTGSLDLNNQE